MCSRFELNARPRDLARHFGLDELPDGFTGGEIRPTDPVLAVDYAGAHVLRWGLSVEWDRKPLINARAETLAEKKTFQPLLESRCLVPATAYFEWRRDGRTRLKNRIATADGEVFSFAGLTDGERLTIVTCAPLASIAHIHNRMPVILTAEAEAAWADPALSFTEVCRWLDPDAGPELDAEEDTPPPPRQPDLFG